MAVIGLTGGIATGKSTVAKLLREKGVPVIDADVAARAVVAPGTPGLAALVQSFGSGILSANGELDRAAMRGRITTGPSAKQTLEGITHPAIRLWVAERIATALDAGHANVVVEAALLVETGGYQMYPTLIVVSCNAATQLQRVMARDGQSEAQARAIVATQLPMSQKEAVATHIIRNEGDLDTLRAAVDEVWQAIVS